MVIPSPYAHLGKPFFVWQSSLAGKPSFAMIFPGVTEKAKEKLAVKGMQGG